MKWPKPIPGLVIRYSYMWNYEFEAGQEEGLKDRPCAVVLVSENEDKGANVTVLPITHVPPVDKNEAVELPAAVKRRLGLYGDRSWIIISEVNEFLWPGPDLRPLPDQDISTIAYGVLPPIFFQYLLKKFYTYRLIKHVPRSD